MKLNFRKQKNYIELTEKQTIETAKRLMDLDTAEQIIQNSIDVANKKYDSVDDDEETFINNLIEKIYKGEIV